MRKLLPLVFILAGYCSYSQSVCGGHTIALSAPNPSNLANPQYSMNPGGNQSGNGIFVISPSVTSTFTLYTTGTHSSGPVTTSVVNTVTVFPHPKFAPTFTQPTCADTAACFNLNLTFQPASPVPQYTVTWEALNIPDCVTAPTDYSCCGLSPGGKSATVTTDNGCADSVKFTINPQPAPATFSFIPLGPTFSITCLTPTIYVSVSNSLINTYTWTSLSTGPISNIPEVLLTYTNQGTWSVTATNTVTGCQKTQTFVVGTNTNPPVSSLSPTFQNITCANPDPVTVTLTAISPTVNLTHFVYAQQGGTFIANTTTAPYQPPPGTHTYVLLDNNNGCFTIKQFTVNTSGGFPKFDLTSTPPGFTLGCNSKSTTVVNFANANTDPPGGALNYTLLAPGSPTNYSTGPASTYTVSVPGTYTAVAEGLSNNCRTKIPVSILQNTINPPIDSVVYPRHILDCYHPQVVLRAHSSNTLSSFLWTWQGVPGNYIGSTLTVDARTTAPTATLVYNYSLTVTNENNKCTSHSVIPVYQNLFPPKAGITTGGTNSLTCTTPTILLTNLSSSGIPLNNPVIPPPSQPAIGYKWFGPSPSPEDSLTSTYPAGIVGEYTMIARDLNNGCTSATTIPIFDNKIYPTVNNPDVPPPSILDCGASSASLTPIVTSATTGLTYNWLLPSNPTPTTSALTVKTLSTNLIGTYTVVVTNTVNACITTATMSVIDGTLTAKVLPDKVEGYAPLTVTFTNSSASALGSGTIASFWSFGNGLTYSAITTNTAKTTYNQPGTYTVTVFLAKGACRATYIDTIHVEIPSLLEIPNVFSPNGDGINDLYFLRASNLSEISMKIFDRWGLLVYELTSETGNIEWDGKNQVGVEVAEGTYFFLLTAKGKDGKTFEDKGTISLVR